MAKETTLKPNASQKAVDEYTANLVSISSRHKRRRAGMEFGPEAKIIDLALLSEAEITALKADPLLVVAAAAAESGVV